VRQRLVALDGASADRRAGSPGCPEYAWCLRRRSRRPRPGELFRDAGRRRHCR
jgi:hypothetical protein